MVIVRVEIDYRAEIPAGIQAVDVSCALESLGTSSLRTRERITLPDRTVAAESITVAVVRDRESKSSRPWSDAERIAVGSTDN
ncbi:MAG: acyl-CoA thioesterase, partial [Actinomycetota bacterium]